eukprot:5993257-Amphidinium_carterae.2
MGQRTKEVRRWFYGKGFSQYINNTDIQTIAATPSSMAMRLLLTIAILNNFTIYTTDVASSKATLVSSSIRDRKSTSLSTYVDNLLVAGDNTTTHPGLPTTVPTTPGTQTRKSTHKDNSTGIHQLERHSSYTTTEQPGATIHLSFAQHYYDKILRAYEMDRCNPTTTPGDKKPPIAAQPLDKERHPQYRTALQQLLWVSQ